MATITGAQALAMVDQQIRPMADQLYRAYAKALNIVNRYNALGGGQTAITTMQAESPPELTDAANFLLSVFSQAWIVEKSWNLQGGTTLVPNTADAVGDNILPQVTGAKCVNVVTQIEQFLNWLLSTAASDALAWTDTGRAGVAYYNTVMSPSQFGNPTLSLTDAENFVTRCQAIVTQYQANSNAIVNVLLAVAQHPTS